MINDLSLSNQCCPNDHFWIQSNINNISTLEGLINVIDLKANSDFWRCNFNYFNINIYNLSLMGHYCCPTPNCYLFLFSEYFIKPYPYPSKK